MRDISPRVISLLYACESFHIHIAFARHFAFSTPARHFAFRARATFHLFSPNPRTPPSRYIAPSPPRPTPGKILLANLPSRGVVSQQRTRRRPARGKFRAPLDFFSFERIWGPFLFFLNLYSSRPIVYHLSLQGLHHLISGVREHSPPKMQASHDKQARRVNHRCFPLRTSSW